MKNNYSASEKAYAAAMLDAEGHIYANRKVRNDTGYPQTYYGVCISNLSRDMLEWIQHRFGGIIYVRKNNNILTLQFVKQQEMYWFLKIVRPYLIIKSDLADLMIQYLESRFESSNKFNKLNNNEIKLIAKIKHFNEIGECYK